MQTGCTPALFELEPVERKKVVDVNGGENMYRRGGAKIYPWLGGSLSP